MKEDTIEIILESVNEIDHTIILRNGEIIIGKTQQTIKLQESQLMEFILTSKEVVGHRTVHHIKASNEFLQEIADFIDANNSTIKANDCPYELEDLQIKLLYCYFIKKMDFDEIAIELVKDEQYLRNVYGKIKVLMDMKHPIKMYESFVKYFASYIYSNIRVKGKPRGKSGNQA
jgi:hypothetical protein